MSLIYSLGCEIMKKFIGTLLAIMLAVSMMAGCKSDSETKELKAISEEMLKCTVKRVDLEREINSLWKEYDEALSGGECCFVLFFDNMTPNVMEVIYPLLSEYGYNGTIVMNDYQMPGGEGCITVKDYNTLIEAGWDFAIGNGSVDMKSENAEENLRKYLDEYKALLSENGFEFPKTFAFARNCYDDKYQDMMIEYGFNVVRHSGENGEKYSYSIKRNGLYLLSSDVICADKTTMKTDMKKAYSEQATYAASVRYVKDVVPDKDLDCGTEKYDLMLEFLEDDCEIARILTATELYDYKSNTVAGSETFMEEFNAKMDSLESQLADVNAQIEKLRDSLSE